MLVTSSARKQSRWPARRIMQGLPACTISTAAPPHKPSSCNRCTTSGAPSTCSTNPRAPAGSRLSGISSCTVALFVGSRAAHMLRHNLIYADSNRRLASFQAVDRPRRLCAPGPSPGFQQQLAAKPGDGPLTGARVAGSGVPRRMPASRASPVRSGGSAVLASRSPGSWLQSKPAALALKSAAWLLSSRGGRRAVPAWPAGSRSGSGG